MRTTINRCILLFAVLLFTGYVTVAQTATSQSKTTNAPAKKTFLVERQIPDAGKFTPAELKAISQKSCSVLKEMGPSIEWVQSYVTGDKIFCVYKAESEELIRVHAKKGGFPANTITEISSVISPATAN